MTVAGNPHGPLTVRLRGPDSVASAVVSDDLGRTWELSSAAEATIREACRDATRELPPPTAAAAATMAEAASLRIVDAADAPREQHEEHWVRRLSAVGGPASTTESAGIPSRPFAEVLASRRSRLQSGPIDAGVLATLLGRVRAPRETAMDAAGRSWESWPVPSAGGTHSIDVLLHVREATGWDPGWYRWDDNGGPPQRVEVAAESRLLPAMAVALRQTSPPDASLVLIAEPRLLHERYPNGGALLWRDAGCMLAISQLVAVDLGLSATPLGICVPVEMTGAVGWNGIDVVIVGAVALGAADGAA